MILHARVTLLFSLATCFVAMVVGLIRQDAHFDTLATAFVCLAFPWLVFGLLQLKARGW